MALSTCIACRSRSESNLPCPLLILSTVYCRGSLDVLPVMLMACSLITGFGDSPACSQCRPALRRVTKKRSQRKTRPAQKGAPGRAFRAGLAPPRYQSRPVPAPSVTVRPAIGTAAAHQCKDRQAQTAVSPSAPTAFAMLGTLEQLPVGCGTSPSTADGSPALRPRPQLPSPLQAQQGPRQAQCLVQGLGPGKRQPTGQRQGSGQEQEQTTSPSQVVGHGKRQLLGGSGSGLLARNAAAVLCCARNQHLELRNPYR